MKKKWIYKARYDGQSLGNRSTIAAAEEKSSNFSKSQNLYQWKTRMTTSYAKFTHHQELVSFPKNLRILIRVKKLIEGHCRSTL